MDPRKGLQRTLLVEDDPGVEERSYTPDELERIVAESSEAAYRMGWAKGYAAGGHFARPLFGVPRHDLEKRLARGALVLLGLAGAFTVFGRLLGTG